MIDRPFDLSVSQGDLERADVWWSSLSINEMKAIRDKHFPAMDWHSLGVRWVHQAWEEEGKPEPEVTIPLLMS